MNTVYYGNHAYGVEAAAQTYFSRPAEKLTFSSRHCSRVSAGTVGYNPFQNPGLALERRNACWRRSQGTVRSPRQLPDASGSPISS